MQSKLLSYYSQVSLTAASSVSEFNVTKPWIENQETLSPSSSTGGDSVALYEEAKESFTNNEISNEREFKENDGESIKLSCSGSDVISAWYKPHRANERRWEAIQGVRLRDGPLEFKHFKPLVKLGSGHVGTVYLSELIGTETYFAMKFMNRETLASKKKQLRAETEREILRSLDHPFLPTLYTHFESEKSSCLVMEFCPGGDLHGLRLEQPGKYFAEHAARFYAAEVLLALEYLHVLGIIYRDLKPENVLLREDGHIMLSNFDLSFRCAVWPTLVKSERALKDYGNKSYWSGCVEPPCNIQPSCFGLRSKGRKETEEKFGSETIGSPLITLPELLAEPTDARSMSLVGTHEYLAPEIIKGEGHGSAVDWWTFGIFLYELLYGRTPFKGAGNRATLFNVVGQSLRFPESPPVSFAARDLIRGLLVKEPEHRLAYRRGATEIKRHPFFQSVNLALIRCISPPSVPTQSIETLLHSADNKKESNVSPNCDDNDFF